jgi:vitamin B12 transporter
MKTLCLAGLAGLATLGAYAQVPGFSLSPLQSVVVTATRQLQPATSLRDTVVITREELEAVGALSLGEVLERRAGVQLRATGGPGQPQGLLMRGANSAQTLVLVDGLRVSSATVGTTSIENIPLEMVERIEVVKGPLSSLYGSDAIGGVVQIFTRGKSAPHLFAAAAYGTDQDRRASAGIATVDERSSVALSLGGRKVDAPSATNPRVAFCHDPDPDPHENAFANLHASHRLWQDELISLDAFYARGRTAFDGCGAGDRNDQTLAGARLVSGNTFTSWWSSRLAIGHGRDKLLVRGAFPARFETLQDQASWIHEFRVPAGNVLAGVEVLRQKVRGDESQGAFARSKRETDSAFAGINEAWGAHRLEASVRRDDDDSFGKHTTGSASYGIDYASWGRVSATYGRGFRAPTFFDLFGPTSPFYRPNPQLRPERSRSRELSWRAPAVSPWQWRVTGFDNRIEDLITYVAPTVENVNRARIRGVEAAVEKVWLKTRWRASFTAQRPRDEDTGTRLPARARRHGSLEATRAFGRWNAAVSVFAMGDREELSGGGRATLPGYAVIDARVAYRFEKFWSVELAATNLADKRYENALGFDAPRRGVLLSVRFDAF